MGSGSVRNRLARLSGRILRGDTRDFRKLTAPFRGNVDGLAGGLLQGWVVKRGTHHGSQRVGLFTSDGLIATCVANDHRADVKDAGFGDGFSGFAFRVEDHPELQAAIANEEEIIARALHESDHEIGRLNSETYPDDTYRHDTPNIKRLRRLLFSDTKYLLDLNAELPSDSPVPQDPKLVPHKAMFAHAGFDRDGKPSEDEGLLPAYVEYTRYRTRTNKTFDPDSNPDDLDHCLDWYLNVYGDHRHGRRVPLSKQAIDYLNAPIVMGGQQLTLTRAMWWRLARHRSLMAQLDLNDPNCLKMMAYWWAVEEAYQLHCEDCLVPTRYCNILRAVDPAHSKDDYPTNTFLQQFQDKNAEFKFLNLLHDTDREAMTLSLLVKAIKRPDLLRYIPARSIIAAFETRDGALSPFAKFVAALADNKPVADHISYARYAALLRLEGFDLASLSFLSVTPEGNRVESAALPKPNDESAPVDVQIIGPFEKASGLGQATRLSRTALEQTDFSLNAVDFDLDNPTPEGFSKVGILSDYKTAKINLIHLNAESIPLVFAYAPDVFSESYNIGYFFWELNTPASCHYLGMELLDEIWVSSEYGVSIYKPEAGKPVTSVGMCFEDVPDLTRKEARDYICRRFRLSGDEFVFLVAFDSFSFVQRKNPLGVLRAFQKAFDGIENVRLIVKTQNRESVSDQVQDRIWKQVEALLESDSRIHVMNETVRYEDVLRLKKGSDCYISLHKSEGWGFGMIEAMNLKTPVVCTAYSGNLEFCNDETAWLVDYEEQALTEDDYIFVRKGQVWAEPDVSHAATQLRAVYENPQLREAKTEAAWQFVQEHFDASAISQRYANRLQEILSQKLTKSRPLQKRR